MAEVEVRCCSLIERIESQTDVSETAMQTHWIRSRSNGRSSRDPKTWTVLRLSVLLLLLRMGVMVRRRFRSRSRIRSIRYTSLSLSFTG